MNLQNSSLNDRLIRLVGQLLGTTAAIPDPFPLNERLSDLGITSLKMVNLMLAIELEFDILIPQAEITPENFHSLATVKSLVERSLGSNGAG